MANEIGGRSPLILFVLVVVIILIVVAWLAYRYVNPVVSSRTGTGCQTAGPPNTISAINFQLTNVKLTWAVATGATRYKVYIGSIPGFDISTSFRDFTTPNTEEIIEDLVLGRTYYFRVQSINGCNSASVLSEEASARLAYPDRFRIVSRTDPNKSLKVAGNFEDVELVASCSGINPDDLCIWSYDENSGEIRTIDSPLVCLKTFPTLVDIGAKVDPCENLSLLNNSTVKVWNYTPSTGSLCNPSNSQGLNCLKVQPNNTDVIRTPFDGDITMEWNIIEA
jgi:hypothetical protein